MGFCSNQLRKVEINTLHVVRFFSFLLKIYVKSIDDMSTTYKEMVCDVISNRGLKTLVVKETKFNLVFERKKNGGQIRRKRAQ